MKRHFRITALLLAAVMVMGLLSGCMDTATQIMIDEDGRTTFVQATYLAEKVITDYGKTPEEYFKKQIEEGGTLGSLECNGNTYWGIVPTPQLYESFDAFCEAMQQSSSTLISAYKHPEYGYETIVFNIPSINKVAEENGQDVSKDGSGYADLLVYTANLNIAGRWYGFDSTGKGEDLVKYEFEEDGHVLDLIMPCTDEDYQVKVWGASAPEEEKMIDSVTVSTSPITEDDIPANIDISAIGAYDGGMVPITDAEFSFWESGDGEGFVKIGDDTPFTKGFFYALKMDLRAPEDFVFAEDCVAKVNGGHHAKLMTDDNSEDRMVFWFDFGKMSSDDALLILSAHINVDEPKLGEEIAVSGTGLLETSEDPIAFDISPEPSKTRLSFMGIWAASENGGKDVTDWDTVENLGLKTFEEGYYYAFYLMMPGVPGADFSADFTADINGEESNQWVLPLIKDGKVTVFHNFGKPEATQAEKPPVEAEKPPVEAEKPPVEPEKPAEKTIPFTDVSESDYFYDAVVWAFNSEPQITDGTSATTFSPAKTCTRGQVVTFLWRAFGCPEPKTSKNPFTDVKESDYFYKPVLWAVECGITDGTSATTFSPASTCKNSHILTFIWRAAGEPDKTGEGSWYTDALNWAEKTGMLKGSYTGKYGVNVDCPRANVVYYLWQMD